MKNSICDQKSLNSTVPLLRFDTEYIICLLCLHSYIFITISSNILLSDIWQQHVQSVNNFWNNYSNYKGIFFLIYTNKIFVQSTPNLHSNTDKTFWQGKCRMKWKQRWQPNEWLGCSSSAKKNFFRTLLKSMQRDTVTNGTNLFWITHQVLHVQTYFWTMHNIDTIKYIILNFNNDFAQVKNIKKFYKFG